MTTRELTELITAIGTTITAIAAPIAAVFGVLAHRTGTRNHEQGKEILKAANGTLTAQTHQTAVATSALAHLAPTTENILAATDAAAVLKSRQEGKAAE